MRKVSILMALVLMLGVIMCQRFSFAHQKEVFAVLEDNPLFVPNAKVLQNVSFGFDNLITDFVWLRTVQYIGGNARASEFPLLSAYLNNLTDLDKRFYMPYFVAQILLPEIGQTDQAILLSEKGVQALPENWKIPAYLGYIYYYYLNDFAKGAEFYLKASEIPGALPSAKRMAINLIGKADKHALALKMWLDLLEEEKNPEIQTLITKKILREKNFVELENAVQKYVALHQTFPRELAVLVQSNLIAEIPSDPIESHKKYTIQDGVIILE